MLRELHNLIKNRRRFYNKGTKVPSGTLLYIKGRISGGEQSSLENYIEP